MTTQPSWPTTGTTSSGSIVVGMVVGAAVVEGVVDVELGTTIVDAVVVLSLVSKPDEHAAIESTGTMLSHERLMLARVWR